MPKITHFGLPDTFPLELVPDEAWAFMREISGMELLVAFRLAKERDYHPLLEPLPDIDSPEHHFGLGLNVDGILEIPFVVRVEAENSARLTLTFETVGGGCRVMGDPKPEVVIERIKTSDPTPAEAYFVKAWIACQRFAQAQDEPRARMH